MKTPLTVWIWHNEGTAVSGIFSWMIRLREATNTNTNLKIKLLDLSFCPYRFEQTCKSEDIYDHSIHTERELIAFLKQQRESVHITNHCFEYLDILQAISPSLLKRSPIVGICHTDQNYYYENILKHQDHFKGLIAVSEECRTSLQKLLPHWPTPIQVLPDWFMALPEEAQKVITTDPLKIIYNGRLIQTQKRVLDLPLICRGLNERGVSFNLDIYGSGPDEIKLHNELAPYVKSRQVKFQGMQAPWSMPLILNEYDIFLQTSEFEGESVSLIEAMSHGLAPVVTATRSGVTMLAHGRNSLMAPPGDTDGICENLHLLQKSPSLIAEIQQSARATGKELIQEIQYLEKLSKCIGEWFPKHSKASITELSLPAVPN